MVFRSKPDRPAADPEESAAQPAPREPDRNPEPPHQVQHSFVGADTKITGDVESSGDLSVEGSVEGNITCRTLTLRGEPAITGDVHAEAVHVCGRFKGALHAKKVVLTKAARMNGDVYYETLELQEGAVFEGGVHGTGGRALKPETSDVQESRESEAALDEARHQSGG